MNRRAILVTNEAKLNREQGAEAVAATNDSPVRPKHV